MNYKEGFKRIFIAFGYLFFTFCGWASTNEEDYIIRVFGLIVGFYIFKGLLYGINWIKEGFKEWIWKNYYLF